MGWLVVVISVLRVVFQAEVDGIGAGINALAFRVASESVILSSLRILAISLAWSQPGHSGDFTVWPIVLQVTQKILLHGAPS